MSLPRIRNGICLEVNPDGCQRHTREHIAAEKARPFANGPKSVLILGASGGYGLASRITAAFGCGAQTLGVSFERPPEDGRDGTPGWYNNLAFDAEARAAGHKFATLNADAFSDATRQLVAETARCEGFDKFDLVIYSLASPVRTDPDTGELHRSVIKPIGEPHTATTVDFLTGVMKPVTIPPATGDEIRATIKVMGGEDWLRWIRFLRDNHLLAPRAKTVAYSYIGPACTQGIYRHGSLGKAKEDLEASAAQITRELAALHGAGYVSVNKALVTRASAVIPAMPPYIAALFKVMKAKGLHEGCLEQTDRLFRERLYTADGETPVDDQGRIRLDDWEMRPDIQSEVATLMAAMTSDNALATTDLDGYRTDFLALHGF